MTQPQRTLLVGVDYSNPSIAAIDRALEMCHGLESTRLVALLALPGGPTRSPPAAAKSSEELVERSRENLVGLVAARAEALDHVSAPRDVEAVVAFGSPAEALTHEAKRLGAHLIVVGTHGRRGVQKLLLGSVAEQVVREAECSVLVARTPETPDAEAPAEPETEAFEEPETHDDEAASALDTQIVGEPHLENGRVVVVVLDGPSQRTFTCAFEQFGSVVVEALEGEWVARASSEERARAARTALALSRAEQATFEQLFAELARRG